MCTILHTLPTDNIPNIIALSGSPATPTSIRISWDFQQDCYAFTFHQVSCYIDQQPASSSMMLAGDTVEGVVGGLAVDTLYNCSVNSTVTVGGVAQSVRSAKILTFTYPDCKHCGLHYIALHTVQLLLFNFGTSVIHVASSPDRFVSMTYR